jgi:hypothetical protein
MPEELLVDNLGKGAVEAPADPRDYHLSFIAGAAAPIDWSREFRLPEPPDSNQASADCCVAEATSYFNWQLTGKQFSVRSVFAYIALGWGALLRDGPQRVYDFGQETFNEAPDPKPKTVSNMRSKLGLNPPDALDDKILKFFDTAGTADQLAQAVRDWKGAIFGLSGHNAGWADKTNPRPPSAGELAEWGHALYAFGYHMHDGLKCIIAKSSWCSGSHHEHHIREHYFESGYVYQQAFVMVPKENIPMVERFRVNYHGTLGIALKVPGAFGIEVYLAKSEAMYQNLLKDYEVPADAPYLFNIPA